MGQGRGINVSAQHLQGTAVKKPAPEGTELRAQRFAYPVVREPVENLAVPCLLGQQASLEQGLTPQQRIILRKVCNTQHCFKIGLLTQHGAGLCRGQRGRRQPAQPFLDHGPYAGQGFDRGLQAAAASPERRHPPLAVRASP